MQEEVNCGSKVCMQFSNEELWKYLITKFENNPTVAIKTLSDDDREIEITSNTPIQFICFDNEDEIYEKTIKKSKGMNTVLRFLLNIKLTKGNSN